MSLKIVMLGKTIIRSHLINCSLPGIVSYNNLSITRYGLSLSVMGEL